MAEEETVVQALQLIRQQLEVHNYLTKRILFMLARQALPAQDVEAWETGVEARVEQMLKAAQT